MTRDASNGLDFEDALCGGLATGEPVGNAALGTETETAGQGALAANGLAGIKESLLGHAPD